MNTKELILQKAIELFNEKGIEYGGMRELAGLLQLRVSNITYYFATKDELVFEIIKQLGKENDRIIESSDFKTLAGFMDMYRNIFYNQYQYRCVFLSFVHLAMQNSLMPKDYPLVERRRKEQLAQYIHGLMENGQLQKGLEEAQIQLIIGSISLLSRFWISEARISHSKLSVDKVIQYYLKLLASFFYPYATTKGRKMLADL